MPDQKFVELNDDLDAPALLLCFLIIHFRNRPEAKPAAALVTIIASEFW
jgi:hypothetical protein